MQFLYFQQSNQDLRMSQSAVDKFFAESPQKVYKQADKFSKTLGRFTQLPSSLTKSRHVKNIAEDRTDDIRYLMEQAKYQNTLYRKLEQNDQKQRRFFDKKIQQKDHKVDMNLEELKKKNDKEVEKINKHLSEVYKKHVQNEFHKKSQKDQEAVKLRKSLLQFYDKQKKRRQQSDAKQIAVPTCYKDAVNRLDKIHQKNQEYAQRSERQHQLRMARNSARDRNILNLTRLKSAENKKKQEVYQANCQILSQKEHKFIQTYCKDLDQSGKAFSFKGSMDQKTKLRIQKFFKDKIEKWEGHKKRIDEQNERVPQKCLNLMDKTTKASFRQTISSFKQSSKNWYNRVQQNKSMIYQRDQAAKDRLMDVHLDMRLRNTSSFKVEERMDSMKRQVKKLSYQVM